MFSCILHVSITTFFVLPLPSTPKSRRSDHLSPAPTLFAALLASSTSGAALPARCSWPRRRAGNARRRAPAASPAWSPRPSRRRGRAGPARSPGWPRPGRRRRSPRHVLPSWRHDRADDTLKPCRGQFARMDAVRTSPGAARLMNTNLQRVIVLSLLVLLMAATRTHVFTHFTPVPDASWAVFFIGGFYLRNWSRWAFPLLMVLAVGIDWAVITGQGMSFWSHYCVSPGYWMLVPAHLAMWTGGLWLRRNYTGASVPALGRLAAGVVVATALCHLFAQGGFYWLSDSVAERSDGHTSELQSPM